MEKTKDSATPKTPETTVTGQVDTPIAQEKPTGSPAGNSGSGYIYFTERDTKRILENLENLRGMVFPEPANQNQAAEADDQRHFPSVCLVGLGRCGSNIAMDVASLVYNARQFYLNEFANQEKANTEQDFGPVRWIRSNFLGMAHKNKKPIFLIEPLVMLGDLDKDIQGRFRFSRRGETGGFLSDYSKVKVMDLTEIHAGGSGNAPILGQYLAKIILAKDSQRFASSDWKLIHSYLIDSSGIKANQSRLYFYIFSAGGGTGSGMASEFGLAQQFSYMSKTFDNKIPEENDKNGDHNFVFEPIFTSGICILPNISDQQSDMSEALHINAGRLLCKYLAEEWNFSYTIDAEGNSDQNVLHSIRPWNAMMLISNDIMRYAEETDDGKIKNIDVNAMERHANQYISQQIFNILTAQAVTSDYDQNYFRRAGMAISETIRLDANDLFMSLAGPVAVAYAESAVSTRNPAMSEKFRSSENDPSRLNIDDLFFRSIDLPHFNRMTQAIEGISLLPIESRRYGEVLERYQKSGFNASELQGLHFFKNCSSVVTVVSLPKDYRLSYVDLSRLKTHLNSLFPNTTLKRYALVIGASTNLSLTTLIAKSPCLSDDFLTLFVAFIKRCFAQDKFRFDTVLDNTILELITADRFDDARIDDMLNEYENPARILDTNWFAIKPMYEKKYRELITDRDKFVSINDIRLSRETVKKAIRYLREIYHHQIGKTRMISLDSYSANR